METVPAAETVKVEYVGHEKSLPGTVFFRVAV
jgi:hypothetical protein